MNIISCNRFCFCYLHIYFLEISSWIESLVSLWQKKFPNRSCYSAVTALSSLTQSWNNRPSNWVGSDPCGSNWAGIGCDNSRITELLDLRSIQICFLLSIFVFVKKWMNMKRVLFFSSGNYLAWVWRVSYLQQSNPYLNLKHCTFSASRLN